MVVADVLVPVKGEEFPVEVIGRDSQAEGAVVVTVAEAAAAEGDAVAVAAEAEGDAVAVGADKAEKEARFHVIVVRESACGRTGRVLRIIGR